MLYLQAAATLKRLLPLCFYLRSMLMDSVAEPIKAGTCAVQKRDPVCQQRMSVAPNTDISS